MTVSQFDEESDQVLPKFLVSGVVEGAAAQNRINAESAVCSERGFPWSQELAVGVLRSVYRYSHLKTTEAVLVDNCNTPRGVKEGVGLLCLLVFYAQSTGTVVPRRRRQSSGTTVIYRDVFVGWLLNVPATCECISGTDVLRQFYVLPH